MPIHDRPLILVSAALLAAGGVAGGLKRWAGAADGLPFVILFVTLPALAVWLGRRAANLGQGVAISGALGAAFMIPSFFFYWAPRMGENLLGLAIAVLAPALIAAVAFKTGPKAELASASPDALRTLAERTRMWSLIGIILFPQIVQPATLDTALRLTQKGEAGIEAANVAKLVGLILLGLIALMSALAILAAVTDAL